MLERGLPRDQLFQHITADHGRIALDRIAPATAAAGADDRFRHARDRNVRTHHRLEVVLAGEPQQIAAGFARLAAPQAPRRTIAPARLLEVPAALDEVAHVHVDAEPAAELAGTA